MSEPNVVAFPEGIALRFRIEELEDEVEALWVLLNSSQRLLHETQAFLNGK
jgi:hypothetical protein|tara:strand:+ start:404 stop:556 length:153 start_codon:yes stop_codon:yes gene_type:complete